MVREAVKSVIGRLAGVAGQAFAVRPLLAAVGLFAGGIVFWGGFNTVMEATNTLPFCISCHEMRSTVYPEYQTSIHHTNASGVQAACPDCHVPKAWTAKFVRKLQASRELLYWALGTIDTPEKFEARRPALAQRVWASLKATDSQECRNCHNFSVMDTPSQGRFAGRAHARAAAAGTTCIDCHRGIAHKLPQSKMPDTSASPVKVDAAAAEEINMTCAPCHGRNGQGTPDGNYPRLAGLDATYIAKQLGHFKDRSRINIPMLPYATERELPGNDVEIIAAYLSSIELPRKLGAVDEAKFEALERLKQSKEVLNIPLYKGNVEAGRRLYAKECSTCHGRDGYGARDRAIPALAGQHSLYLLRQIELFKKGERLHEEKDDAAIFAQFHEAEVADLLAFLSTLDDG